MRHPKSLLRALIVALLMVGWLAASNHCAFGLMRMPTAKAAPPACAGCGSAPGQQVPASGGIMECCKALQGVPADLARIAVESDTSHFALLDFVTFAVSSVESAAVRSLHETGPPPALSFAERILQRSLLSHAPPFAV